ncbi:MAG: hypothetical protein JOZ68_18070 [Acidimicrobiia bacterium]|nr:hypothetical protein [Acidimicrobiia bacterium]
MKRAIGTRRLALWIGGTAIALLALATPASAHDATPRGTVSCSSDQQVVRWTVTNSQTGSGQDMSIVSATSTRGTVTGFPSKVAPGATARGTTTLPGDATGSVALTVHAHWNYDGYDLTQSSPAVSLGGNCGTPLPAVTTLGTFTAPGAIGVVGLVALGRRRRSAERSMS